MRRTFLIPLAAAALVAAGGLAMAQQGPSRVPMGPGQHIPAMSHDGARHGMWRHHDMRHGMGRRHGPVGAVIGDLRRIARLYIMQGQPEKLEGVYKHVLASTQNPWVRNYAYDALARLQARPRDTRAAIATLRKSLDENLQRLNRMPTGKR